MAKDDTQVVALIEREAGYVVVEVPVPVTVGSQEQLTQVSEAPEQEFICVEQPQTVVVAVGQQGPPGPPGGAAASIFIQDVTGIGGIVGQKTWADTVPPQADILTATSDTGTVRVWVAAAGGKDYNPMVSVNGVPVTLTESSTRRWFTGYADLVLHDGDNVVTAETDEGAIDTVIVTLAGPGPNVLDVLFGNLPGAQTELKAGDVVGVTIITEPDAVSVTILAGGAAASAVTLPVADGVASGFITISGASGAQGIQVKAKNDLGTFGTIFTSASLPLNQTYPSISTIVPGYPSGQGALNTAEVGSITATVTNADVVEYVSNDLLIDAPNAYASTKTVTNARVGYVGTGSNITISATRAANGAVTVRSGLVCIATVPPKAAITIAGNPSRLISSPTGQDYEVRITPDQMLSGTPSLDASLGTWLGVWTLSGSYWKRTLRITDSTPRGTGVFANLTMTGLSGIQGNEITSGSTYVVGGMVTRNITFPAFARVAALGTNVGDATKTSAQVSGGNVLARQTNNAVVQNAYYIANADGSYNAQGGYLGLSDTTFAGSNTSGSLVVIFGETA